MPNEDLKDPPIFSNDVKYGDWKIDMDIWELDTTPERSSVISQCVRGLTGAEDADGVKTITDRLDKVFHFHEKLNISMSFK